MAKLLIIGLGGFLGSILRYSVSELVLRLFSRAMFPYGTLAVNVIGCLLIGLLGGFWENRQLFQPEFRWLIIVGFLGGFTTFSTFGYEVFRFARDGQPVMAMINCSLHFLFGIGAVWLGYAGAKLI